MQPHDVRHVSFAPDMAQKDDLNILFGENPIAARQAAIDMASELLHGTQLYLDFDNKYGVPRPNARVGSVWIGKSGDPIDILFTSHMRRGYGKRPAIVSALQHLSCLSDCLRILFQKMTDGAHVSGHALRKYEASSTSNDANAVFVNRLVATLSYESQTHVTRYSLGLSPKSDTRFYSNSCVLHLKNGTRGSHELLAPDPHLVSHIEIGALGVRWVLVVEKECAARVLADGATSLWSQAGIGGGILLACSGTPTLMDLTWSTYLAKCFPDAPVITAFDMDLNGLNAVATLRRGLENGKNLTEFTRLALGDERVTIGALTLDQLDSVSHRGRSAPFKDGDATKLDKLTERFPEGERPMLRALGEYGRWHVLEQISALNGGRILSDRLATLLRSLPNGPSRYVIHQCNWDVPAFPAAHMIPDLLRAARYWDAAYHAYVDREELPKTLPPAGTRPIDVQPPMPMPQVVPMQHQGHMPLPLGAIPTAVPPPVLIQPLGRARESSPPVAEGSSKRRKIGNELVVRGPGPASTVVNGDAKLVNILLGASRGTHWSWSEPLEDAVGLTEDDIKAALPTMNGDVSATLCVLATGQHLKKVPTSWRRILASGNAWLEANCPAEDIKHALQIIDTLLADRGA